MNCGSEYKAAGHERFHVSGDSWSTLQHNSLTCVVLLLVTLIALDFES